MGQRDITTINALRLAQGPQSKRVSLVVYHHDGAEVVRLVPDVPVVIGRAEPADVALPDPSLSRQHARLLYDGSAISVEDLGSTNGTQINGRATSSGLIKQGDEVQLGAVRVAVHVLEPNAPELADFASYDRFVVGLDDEILRATTFSRPLSLMMVRASKRAKSHLSHWAPQVRQLLRPVDRVALYGPSALLISMPELTLGQAEKTAQTIIAERSRKSTSLFIGLATYPQCATSAESLVEAVREASHSGRTRQPIQRAPDAFAPPTSKRKRRGGDWVVGERLAAVFETAERAAPTQLPVLISGETGTGKEVLAQFIHQRSRRAGQLCCINCGAIPRDLVESTLFGHERGAFTGASDQRKGLFEQADGGTVLLDEIGELAAAAQAALLRVLETKRVRRVGSTDEIAVDVRVLAATHRDLEQMCQTDQFRWDLLYRLNTMQIELPALRERRDEILPLAEYFIQLANKAAGCQVHTIDDAAAALLQSYSWPGNVRELRNAVERAVVVARDDVITASDLPDRVRRGAARSKPAHGASHTDLKEKVRRYEAELLLEALEQHYWNQTETAKQLGIPLRTLVHKIKALGLTKR